MNKALIIGSAGQDGSYLAQQLTAQGVGVAGVDRGFGLRCDLADRAQVLQLVRACECDALFYLAAHHHSSEDPTRALGDELLRAYEVHVVGWLHCLDALWQLRPTARAFYAASSHVFGEPQGPVCEETPMRPRTAYAVTKAAGLEVGRLYRARGLKVSAGFLFNHESPRRPARFVSQRIVRGAVAAARARARGEDFALELGSLAAVVDWGFAPDYADAMVRAVNHQVPDDYVVATGIPHSIADFCAAAFGAVGLDYRAFVTERPERVTRHLPELIGDASKLSRATGWKPTVTFERMVQIMIEAAQNDGSMT